MNYLAFDPDPDEMDDMMNHDPTYIKLYKFHSNICCCLGYDT